MQTPNDQRTGSMTGTQTATLPEAADPGTDEREENHASQVTTPIVVSLGAESKKAIKRLKRGRGRLMDEVADVVEEVRANLGEEAAGKVFVPIVMVYRRDDPDGMGLWPFGVKL